MTETGAIPGLSLCPNAINKETESQLYKFLMEQKWVAGPGGKNGRRVQQYGYSYDYTTKTIKDAPPIPQVLSDLILKLTEQKLLNGKINQIIVNEYVPGQGITPHTDHVKWFGEQISSLTLGSGCNMIFGKMDSKICETIYLEPRSLIMLTGESRWKFTHSIPAVKKDKVGTKIIPRGTRLSITFRQVL
jgi:alkylated DNA repair dioxygenase AlkB